MISDVVLMGLTGNSELPPTKTYQKNTAVRVHTDKDLHEPWALISSWEYADLAGDDLNLRLEVWVNDSGALLDCVHRALLVDEDVSVRMENRAGEVDTKPQGYGVLRIECTNYRAEKLIDAHKASMETLEDAWA